MAELLRNPHPDHLLQEGFPAPLGPTAYWLAKELGVPPTRVTKILAGKRSITADTALRLGRYFRITPQFWLNLQAAYALEEARCSGLDLNRITPGPRPDLEAESQVRTIPRKREVPVCVGGSTPYPPRCRGAQ